MTVFLEVNSNLAYSDHALTSASWTMPGQKEKLLDTYEKVLIAQGKTTYGLEIDARY